MKKITSLFVLLIAVLAINAQSNWTYNATATRWEKNITPDMFQFSTQTTAQVQSNIHVGTGGGNPNPAVNTTSGQDLSNGYFLITGGQVSSATDPTLTNVRLGYNVMNAITLGSKTGNFLRLATLNATITEGTKSAIGGYFNWNWYIPTKFNYSGYTLVYKDSVYQEVANAGVKFSVVKEDGTSLLTDQVLGAAGWNVATFTQTAAGLPFRFKTTIPNTSGLIIFSTNPKFLLTKTTEPTIRTITVNNTGYGNTTAQYTVVHDQDQQIFTFTPNAGESLTGVTYNGTDVLAQVVGNKYTTPLLTANGTLNVTYSSLGTGIETNDKGGFKVAVSQETLHIQQLEMGQEVSVYNITGKLLYSETAASSTVSVPLNKGVYIVKVNNKSVKVAI